MRRFGWVAFALVSLMVAAAPAARAEKRIALLIGNQSYSTEVGRLGNPSNDVALLKGVLKRSRLFVTLGSPASTRRSTRTCAAFAKLVPTLLASSTTQATEPQMAQPTT